MEQFNYCNDQAKVLYEKLTKSDKLEPYFNTDNITIIPLDPLRNGVDFKIVEKMITVSLLPEHNSTRDPNKNIYELIIWTQNQPIRRFTNVDDIIYHIIDIYEHFLLEDFDYYY